MVRKLPRIRDIIQLRKSIIMNKAPLTFLFDYAQTNDKTRPYFMREFVENGCNNQVLTDWLISEIIRTPSFEKKLHEDVANTGITFMDAHAPFGPREDLDVVDPFERELMLDRLRLSMRIASRFGIETITIHTGNGRRAIPGYTAEQYHEAIIQSLEALLPLAESLNMIICIENIWFETNTPEKLLDILARVNSPYLGICYDSGHANLMARDRGVEDSAARKSFFDIGPVPYDEHILDKLLPHVVNCHLHDNNGINDQHRLPGLGDIDWERTMKLLATAPKLKCVQSEVSPVRDLTPIALLCKTFKELMAL